MMKPPQIFSLDDFDNSLANTGRDAVPALRKALEASRENPWTLLIIPPGRYDLYPDDAAKIHYGMSNTEPINPRTVAMPFYQMEDFTFRAVGATFVYHGRMMPIALEQCQRIRLVGLTIDAAVPSYCQGRVEAVDDESIDIFVEENADIRLEDGKLVRYGEGWSRRVGGHQLVYPDGSVVYNTADGPLGELKAESLGENRFRLQKPRTVGVEVGMYLILRAGWRDHAGIFIYRSRDILLDNVTLHFANGTGILGQHSENITMRESRVEPRAGRIYSTFADATHWSGVKGILDIANCQFSGHLDDAANVHGTSTVVQEISGDHKLVGAFRHWESVDLLWAEAGDTISFFSRQTLVPFATATVVSFALRDAETFVLELDTLPEGVVAETAMENLTWNPDFIFRGNTVRRHRARGILVSTPGKTLIEGNTFSSPGAAIVIAGDANGWFESGAVRDVTIKNNVFDNCNTSGYGSGAAVIHIDPVIPTLDETAPCYHSNICIEDNLFRVFDTPYVAALSVDGLKITGNSFIPSDKFPPRINAPHGFVFDSCRNINIEGNRFLGEANPTVLELKSGKMG